MIWQEIRKTHPDQWLIIEALEAYTTPEKQRELERIAVIERCLDGRAAMQAYQRLHELYPQREFYYVHTAREKLDIRERHWLGIHLGQGHGTYILA